MSAKFRLLHLSDLHFSHGAVSVGDHSHSIGHLQGIEKIVKHLDFDRVIVSGDVSNRGDLESLNQASEWLFDSFGIGDNKRTGLGLNHEKTIVVPGNHDAYNCRSDRGSILELRQRAVSNFNFIFKSHQFTPDTEYCQYHWVEKDGDGLFIVAVDSCFLGDPVTEDLPDMKRWAVSLFSQIARGKMSAAQSQQVLDWFDMGMRGRLPAEPNSETLIAGDKFARSFKVIVMHHYIFEPPEYRNSISLRIIHRNTVFRNLAMADFDLLLCGHKHVAAFLPESYGKYFLDRRSKGRYLVNLFRRMIRIHSLPLQITTPEGKQISKRLSDLIHFLVVKTRRRVDETDQQFMERILYALRAMLENPAAWRDAARQFGGVEREHDTDFFAEPSEFKDISRQIARELNKEERKQLYEISGKFLDVVKKLSQRPFVQSMCGSSAKASSRKDKRRSFSIYEIEIDKTRARLKLQEYPWEAGADGFAAPFERTQVFERQIGF